MPKKIINPGEGSINQAKTEKLMSPDVWTSVHTKCSSESQHAYLGSFLPELKKIGGMSQAEIARYELLPARAVEYLEAFADSKQIDSSLYDATLLYPLAEIILSSKHEGLIEIASEALEDYENSIIDESKRLRVRRTIADMVSLQKEASERFTPLDTNKSWDFDDVKLTEDDYSYFKDNFHAEAILLPGIYQLVQLKDFEGSESEYRKSVSLAKSFYAQLVRPMGYKLLSGTLQSAGNKRQLQKRVSSPNSQDSSDTKLRIAACLDKARQMSELATSLEVEDVLNEIFGDGDYMAMPRIKPSPRSGEVFAVLSELLASVDGNSLYGEVRVKSEGQLALKYFEDGVDSKVMDVYGMRFILEDNDELVDAFCGIYDRLVDNPNIELASSHQKKHAVYIRGNRKNYTDVIRHKLEERGVGQIEIDPANKDYQVVKVTFYATIATGETVPVEIQFQTAYDYVVGDRGIASHGDYKAGGGITIALGDKLASDALGKIDGNGAYNWLQELHIEGNRLKDVYTPAGVPQTQRRGEYMLAAAIAERSRTTRV